MFVSYFSVCMGAPQGVNKIQPSFRTAKNNLEICGIQGYWSNDVIHICVDITMLIHLSWFWDHTIPCIINTRDKKKFSSWCMLVRQKLRSLKARFSEHQQPSSMTSEVSKHIHFDHPQHSVELENTEVLTTEPTWFERGVKEAIYYQSPQPKPQQRWREVQFITSMGQHHQEERKGSRLRRRWAGICTMCPTISPGLIY